MDRFLPLWPTGGAGVAGLAKRDSGEFFCKDMTTNNLDYGLPKRDVLLHGKGRASSSVREILLGICIDSVG